MENIVSRKRTRTKSRKLRPLKSKGGRAPRTCLVPYLDGTLPAPRDENGEIDRYFLIDVVRNNEARQDAANALLSISQSTSEEETPSAQVARY